MLPEVCAVGLLQGRGEREQETAGRTRGPATAHRAEERYPEEDIPGLFVLLSSTVWFQGDYFLERYISFWKGNPQNDLA